MKYRRVRVIDNGIEKTISVLDIDDTNRSYYRGKLYCPQVGCTAKLHENTRNGRIYYQAYKKSHIPGCPYENEENGTVGVAGESGLEIPLSEKHFELSIRNSYKNSTKPLVPLDEGRGKKAKIKRVIKDKNGEIKTKVKGVITGEKIVGVKEPPILSRKFITDLDIGRPRKIVGIKIGSVEEVSGTLKIRFDNKNYENLYALIGEPYKEENGVSDEKIHMIKEYIDYHIQNGLEIKFWGGGIINKYNNSNEYVMELFYQESFLINGLEILGICNWIRTK
ncbi:hypothetical protein P5E85_02250 [Clostridium perfringens]|nr:hypothetical protein [Clostridium perfringens]MDM0446292.1 hypothetical protein [Clostridium perfringens]